MLTVNHITYQKSLKILLYIRWNKCSHKMKEDMLKNHEGPHPIGESIFISAGGLTRHKHTKVALMECGW